MTQLHRSRRLTPPPSAVHWLERRLAQCAWRESILGDLDEEHAAITRRRSRFAADCFYWWQAIRLPRDRNATRQNLLKGVMTELRIAIRSAFKQPAHTALVIVALALGLGLNAAVFGIGDALLLRPFPFEGVDRLLVIGDKQPGEFGNLAEDVSPGNYRQWRAASAGAGPFESLAAWEWWNANLTGGGTFPERVQAFRVTPGFFSVIGVPLRQGREFADGEDVPGRDNVVVLSHGLWERRFGANPGLLNTPIMIEGRAHTVIGIGPPNFTFPNGAEIWLPLAYDAATANSHTIRPLTVAARLKPGATLDDARAHMAVVSANLKKQYPAENGPYDTEVAHISKGLNDPGSGNLIIVWQLSALLVLLIACANVASLLLARGAARAREIAVRMALGSSRWRLIRQLMLESMVLAALAIPAALGLAWWMLAVLKSYMPARIALFIAGWTEIGLDGRVILFTTCAAIITTLVFGLLPALQSSSMKLVDTLKEGGRGSTSGRLRLRRMLVTAEIALALPLLVAAGMTALGTYRFLNGPQGYDPNGVLTFRVALTEATYPSHADRARFAERAVEALRAVPGVTAAAETNVVPSSNSGWRTNYAIEGRPLAPGVELTGDFRTVTPGYFDTMRQPITRGRGFTNLDTASTQPVAIVSESFVAQHWPDEDPIGRRVVFTGAPEVTATVVGVAGDYVHDWFVGAHRPTLFRPTLQRSTGSMGFVVRTSGEPAALGAAVREAIARVDPQQPVFQIMTQRQLVHERTIGPQYAAGMMGLFGALALLLSAIGIYALVGYYVMQRRQEIGLRMALGASRGHVVRGTVRQAATMAAWGVAIGSVAAFLLGRVLESAMLGIAHNDQRLLAAFAAVLALSALAAGYLPARRAAAIDPMAAMRD